MNPCIKESLLIVHEATNAAGENMYIQKVGAILEDAKSPITQKYHEKLFQSVIDKGHADFSGIERSKGNIKDYSGYKDMMEVLDVMNKLASNENNGEVLKYTAVVKTAVDNIASLSSTYAKGFMVKNDYVITEYNTYVYTCVEATTTLLYEFVDYIKRPDVDVMKIILKNSKYRANLFYFDQLTKFNNVVSKMGAEYRKMLEALCSKGKENFFGVDEAIGLAAVSLAALAVVPITREIIYRIYKIRGTLSRSLELQATFLEMNRACLEANNTLDVTKRNKIIEKQKNLTKKLRSLADFIRIKNAKADVDSKRELANDNKMLSINNLRDEVSNSSLELI